MDVVLSINLIISNPNVRNGHPCIVGTGLCVSDIVMAHLYHDQIPDEIATNYDISVASVHAALAYYYGHKADIDDEIRTQIETARQLKDKWIANGNHPILP